jgi:formylmethanofuran dehydrogenase subunit E
MNLPDDLPDDFREAVRFHGHLCPGLAIGYVAAKVAVQLLGIGTSEDEEIVAVVENNSCAVDAVQVLLGCTFGKISFQGLKQFYLWTRTTARSVSFSTYAGADECRKSEDRFRQSGRGKGKWEVEAERNRQILSRSPIFLIREVQPNNLLRKWLTAVRTLRKATVTTHVGNG